MNVNVLLETIIRPTLRLMGPQYEGARAEVMLIAIALQESALLHRVQVRGPAHGLWQFEKGGGVRGVLRHPSSNALAKGLAEELLYEPTEGEVYAVLPDNDILACIFARLLLWTDAKPMPDPADEAATWDYYQRNWRPGKPHPETWAGNLHMARGAVLQ